MMYLKSFVVFAFCLRIQNGSNQNPPFRPNFWTPRTPSSKIQDSNVTIYLGYANNLFGASPPPHKEKGAFLKEYLRTFEQPPDSPLFVDNQIDPQPLTQEQRSKRGVIHLYSMISCATGCNPLIYKGYGCYCGFMGGGYVVDGIDRCCANHDWCYDQAKCSSYYGYVAPYYWTCHYNRPLCAIPRDQFGGPWSCEHRFCECDRLLAECLSQYPCPSKRAVCGSSPLRRLVQNALNRV